MACASRVIEEGRRTTFVLPAHYTEMSPLRICRAREDIYILLQTYNADIVQRQISIVIDVMPKYAQLGASRCPTNVKYLCCSMDYLEECRGLCAQNGEAAGLLQGSAEGARPAGSRGRLASSCGEPPRFQDAAPGDCGQEGLATPARRLLRLAGSCGGLQSTEGESNLATWAYRER